MFDFPSREDKDIVTINKGVHEGIAWSSTVYLTASGTYYSIVKVGKDCFLTSDVDQFEVAKWQGLSKVAEILEVE